MMQIKAIGFDLFNTLITVEPHALDDGMSRLISSLQRSGITLEQEAFKKAHRESAMWFIKETRKDGRETHNRFWISAALETQGYKVPPDDTRIARAVDAYFSVFLEHCHLIPGTTDMLGSLKGQYRLGLLSNFTDAPAAKKIIDIMGLTSFFDVILISGELGYRKPHPFVFNRLIGQLGVQKRYILFVGDDSDADITGARKAGLQPVWMTYVQDNNIPLARGLLSRSVDKPDFKIPRISAWKDLFDLLDKE